MKRAVGIIILVLLCSPFAPARAAQITEVRDSFEKEHPFGMALNIRYQYLSETAKILREHTTTDSIQLLNQLQSTRSRHVMHFDIAIGLYKDLELVVNLPLVLKDQTNLDFHPDVTSAASSEGKDPRTYGYLHELDPSAEDWDYVDPTTGTMPYAAGTIMDLPYTGRKRSGLDNIGIGLRWAPWSYTRDKMYPTWVLGVMFRLPTAAIRKADNDAVGDGLFKIDVNTTISRRVASFFEPYFDLHGRLIAGSRSGAAFGMEDDTTQTLQKPGHSLGLKLGAEFIPWEVESKKQHFSIDLGVGLDYVFEGREYSPLWEALGGSPCRTSNGCMSTTYARDIKAIDDQIAKYYKQYQNKQISKDDFLAKQTELEGQLDAKYAADSLARTDGVTDVEHYGIYSGWLGMHVQPIEYFAIGATFLVTYTQPHFITFADPGKDSGTDTDDIVTGTNSWGENEYNPKYLENFDRPGNRFKLDQPFSWTILVTMTGQF